MHISDMVRAFSSNQIVDNKVPKGTKGTNSAPAPERGASSQGNNTLASLSKGETFEGNVSKVEGDRVTLSLSNGETVSARLAEDVPVKEGQSIFFQVKSNDGSMVNIRPVSIDTMQNPMLRSALSAAGLPQSERNVSMVHEMMQEQLPIDAESLSEMARNVAMHPKTDVGTLITMQKVGLPITDETIQQFNNYKESEGAILDTVDELLEGMGEIFAGPATTDADAGAFVKNLMSILGTEEGVVPHLFTGEGEQIPVESTGEAVVLEVEEESSEIEAEPSVEGEAVQEEAAAAGEAVLEETAEGGPALTGNTNTSVDAAVVTEEGSGTAAAKASENSESAPKSVNKEVPTDTAATTGAESEAAGKATESDDPIQRLQSRFENILRRAGGQSVQQQVEQQTPKTLEITEENVQREKVIIESADNDEQLVEVLKNTPGDDEAVYPRNTVGNSVDTQQGKELVTLLKELSIDTKELTDKDGNLKKDLNTTELFAKIIEEVESKPEEAKNMLGRLFKNDAFLGITKDAMAQRWTLPPEKVADKQALKAFYAKLSVDMERLSNVASEAAKGANPVSNAADSIKNNVDFINQINQMYNYIQLPLKLAGGQATGDMYVYSNKKRNIGENDELTAFLHFDLEHLGSTDISVKMKNKKVSTNFYMADDASFDLIEKNLPILQEKLERLGYSVSLNVSHDEETVDFVEDFLKQGTSAGSDIRRYTFDMMA